jgi:hypothetical protein
MKPALARSRVFSPVSIAVGAAAAAAAAAYLLVSGLGRPSASDPAVAESGIGMAVEPTERELPLVQHGSPFPNISDAGSLSDAELRASLESLLTDVTPAAENLRRGLLRRWAEHDPAGAARWAAAVERGPARSDILEQAAIVWAETDLTAALDWAMNLPDDSGRQSAGIAVAYEAARANPLLSLDIASRMDGCVERDALLCHAVAQWGAGGRTDEAAAWVAQIRDPVLQERLLAALAVAAAESDGETAAAMVATNLRPGPLQELTAVQVAQRWYQQSPAAASAWVAGFPAGTAAAAAEESLHAIRTISARQQTDSN